MNIPGSSEGEQQLKVPEKPKSPVPEVKAVKPLGQAEQGMVNLIKEGSGVNTDRNPRTGNPDAALQRLAAADVNQPEVVKTPWEEFMADSGDKTKIVGGEIISPTAVRVSNQEKGETYEQVRKEAEIGGWLSAITSAYGKRELPDAERQKNVQDIVDAAMAVGVPREQIGAHLQTLGVATTRREAVQGQGEQAQVAQPTSTEVRADEATITKSLDYVNKLAGSVLAGRSGPSALQNYVDYSIRNGVSRDQIEAVLRARGINVQRKRDASNGDSEHNTKSNEVAGGGTVLEKVKNADNQFDDEAALQIIDVARDWVRYGGNFYDHLTGKDPRLARGVDYKALPDGKPDMESYRAARHQRVEVWLQQPGNQKWLKDAEQFSQDHTGEIGGMETVQVKQPDGSLADKQRYTTPYFYDNGWLYYESSYFDKQTGQMTQPDRESTKYRVYFSPEGGDVMGTFQDVITQLNANPELKRLGFQIKTADANKLGELEVSQIMNQRDRVVLYLGEEGMQAALPILQKYAEANPQRFTQEGVLLGQPLMDSQGKEIPGVVIASEPRGKSPDPAAPGEYRSFSEVQGRIIESSFRTIIGGLRDPNNAAQLQAKYPELYRGISALRDKAATIDYMRAILADPNGADFLKRNLQNAYPQWAKAYGLSTQNIAFQAQV